MADTTRSGATRALPTQSSYIVRFAFVVLLPLFGGWLFIDCYMQKREIARLKDRVEALENRLQHSPER